MSRLQRLIDLDQRISACLAIPQAGRWRRLLALIAAHSGDSPLWLGAGAAAIALGRYSEWQTLGWRVVAGTLAAGIAVTALKWLFRRPRPSGQAQGFYSLLDRHAFPSGHAGRSACVALLIAPVAPSWTSFLLVFWVAAVGLARIALQVHFASDILGGWLVGILVGALLLLAF